MAQRKVLPVQEKIYLLFDVNAGDMLNGVYKTRERALQQFATFMIEIYEHNEEIYYDGETLNVERTSAMLEQKNWKIMTTTIDD